MARPLTFREALQQSGPCMSCKPVKKPFMHAQTNATREGFSCPFEALLFIISPTTRGGQGRLGMGGPGLLAPGTDHKPALLPEEHPPRLTETTAKSRPLSGTWAPFVSVTKTAPSSGLFRGGTRTCSMCVITRTHHSKRLCKVCM
jgi:hypothetical protein